VEASTLIRVAVFAVEAKTSRVISPLAYLGLRMPLMIPSAITAISFSGKALNSLRSRFAGGGATGDASKDDESVDDDGTLDFGAQAAADMLQHDDDARDPGRFRAGDAAGERIAAFASATSFPPRRFVDVPSRDCEILAFSSASQASSTPLLFATFSSRVPRDADSTARDTSSLTMSSRFHPGNSI